MVVDKDGRPVRRRRTVREQDMLPVDDAMGRTTDSVEDIGGAGKPPRECPVPKPTSIIGQLLGVQSLSRRPMEVVVVPKARNVEADTSSRVP